MSKLNLCLHTGASSVTREQVETASTPDATETWRPIAHKTLIDMLVARLPKYNMRIVDESHGMYKDGSRYFGLFQVENCQADNDFGLVFGLRNSHDKSFPAGLCLGSGVFVCDNLAFSAEIVLGRRHTKNIMRDLPHLVSKAVGNLVDARVQQAKRIEAYKQTEITDTQAHDLIIEGLRAGAINTTRIPKVVDQWHTPAHPEFSKEKNAWRLFNGFTEVYKDTNLTDLPPKTRILHGLLDTACGLELAEAE